MWDYIIPQPSVVEDPKEAQQVGVALYGFFSVYNSNLFWNYITDVWATAEDEDKIED